MSVDRVACADSKAGEGSDLGLQDHIKDTDKWCHCIMDWAACIDVGPFGEDGVNVVERSLLDILILATRIAAYSLN